MGRCCCLFCLFRGNLIPWLFNKLMKWFLTFHLKSRYLLYAFWYIYVHFYTQENYSAATRNTWSNFQQQKKKKSLATLKQRKRREERKWCIIMKCITLNYIHTNFRILLFSCIVSMKLISWTVNKTKQSQKKTV